MAILNSDDLISLANWYRSELLYLHNIGTAIAHNSKYEALRLIDERTDAVRHRINELADAVGVERPDYEV